MTCRQTLCAAIALLCLVAGARAESWQATVTHVTDGDTLWVRHDEHSKPVKVRLDHMDAPEICQAGGRAARDMLRARVAGHEVRVTVSRRDDYGRWIANVSHDGTDIAGWMVARGQAWSYRYGREGGPLLKLQLRAQAARVGLFADAAAEAPHVFRKVHGPCNR